MASFLLRSSPGFLSGAGFSTEQLLQRCFRTKEELLSLTPFPCRYSEAAPAEFAIRRGPSGGVLFPKRFLFSERKPVFCHVVSCDEIAFRKILLQGEIQD
jgi:hypothetical protein